MPKFLTNRLGDVLLPRCIACVGSDSQQFVPPIPCVLLQGPWVPAGNRDTRTFPKKLSAVSSPMPPVPPVTRAFLWVSRFIFHRPEFGFSCFTVAVNGTNDRRSRGSHKRTSSRVAPAFVHAAHPYAVQIAI